MSAPKRKVSKLKMPEAFAGLTIDPTKMKPGAYQKYRKSKNNQPKRQQTNISTQQIHDKPSIANGSRRKRKRKKAVNLFLDDEESIHNDDIKVRYNQPGQAQPSTITHNDNYDDKDKTKHSNIPQFISSAPLSTFTRFKVRVAIDFGTDGIALAYAIGELNDIKAHSEWAGKKFKPKFKPKTIILLDENGNVLGFGKDAKHTYMATEPMKDKWMLFERFKMALYDDECEDNDDRKDGDKIAIKDTLTATNGKTVKASVVFIAAFKHLQKEAKKYMKKKQVRRLFPELKDSEIQWIITVPAIWNDQAKYRMRQWTIDAGLVDENIDDQCKIVYEPDCASLAIQYEINRNKAQISNATDDDKKEFDNNGDTKFSKGEKYILVDAGGGTTDIACHEILGENGEYGVKEILAPSGGPWGSCYIDDEFILLLKKIFGDEWIEEFKKEKSNIYTELLDNFQRAKADFFKQEKEIHNVEIPFDFIAYIQDKLEEEDEDAEIEDLVSNSNTYDRTGLVELNDDFLQINQLVWQEMFDSVMDPTIDHIKSLLNEPKLMRNCKYLCLAGGLSTSPYFQHKMRREFGLKSRYKLQLIIPQRPILSVVEGAAYFAITQNYIKSRVLRYTYGQIVCCDEAYAKESGVPMDWISKNKFYDDDGNEWISGYFEVLASKDDTISTGQIIKSYSTRTTTKQMHIRKFIMVSNMKEPKIESNGTELGYIDTIFDNNDEDDMDTTLEFHFYETVIKAVAYRDKEPHIKRINYINNYQ